MTAARLNPVVLDRAMVARGIDSGELCRLTGLSSATVSRMRRGYPVTPATFRRLLRALESVPVSALTNALLSTEER
jgi:DNA-binding Xre family transcriptional regulator